LTAAAALASAAAMRRAALALLLAALVVPGTLARDAPRRADHRQTLIVEPLPYPPFFGTSGVRVAGAWRLSSPNDAFGSYSALVERDGVLAAFSDNGAILLFAPPGEPKSLAPRIARLAASRLAVAKRERDCEAVTRDPSTGTLWAAYEQSNTILRLGPDLAVTGRVRPPAMRDWPANRGPEAMVRLADGRFIVIAETQGDDGSHPALLFPGDPIHGGAPTSFAYLPPPGFRPTDIAALPDGRVVVLNRELLFPWRFRAALSVLDPAAIRGGRTWQGRDIALFGPAGPVDNYEGLAIVPRRDGAVTLWLISDDNQAARVQRTLVMKLIWNPGVASPDDA
jgi:hypothetical protein